LEAFGGLLDLFGLAENAAADGDDGVGGQNVGVGDIAVVGDLVARRLRLGFRQTGDESSRHLTFAGRFVDRGRSVCVRFETDLGKERNTPWTGAGEYELWSQLRRLKSGTIPRDFAAQCVASRTICPC